MLAPHRWNVRCLIRCLWVVSWVGTFNFSGLWSLSAQTEPGQKQRRMAEAERVAKRRMAWIPTNSPAQFPHSIRPNKAHCIQLKATIVVWHCMTIVIRSLRKCEIWITLIQTTENHRATQYTSETCSPERASQHPLGTPPAYLQRLGGKTGLILHITWLMLLKVLPPQGPTCDPVETEDKKEREKESWKETSPPCFGNRTHTRKVCSKSRWPSAIKKEHKTRHQ